jgi:hypothetical protein
MLSFYHIFAPFARRNVKNARRLAQKSRGDFFAGGLQFLQCRGIIKAESMIFSSFYPLAEKGEFDVL